MKHSGEEQRFYDLTAIKEIPILSVADALGIHIVKRGRNHWCKIRNEKDPSVILHTDRNFFYDFGNQAHGDVIHFVQYAMNVSFSEAIRYLGETFGLVPKVTRQELLQRPLTNWEYSRIGLYGDMATKNFVFPIETATTAELSEMASSFRMPLNALQKQEPEIYRELIQKTAIPFVENLRSKYFLDVWNYFHLAYALGDNSIRLYRSEKVRERFHEDTKALNTAERVLYRACRNAGLESPEPLRHDPVEVIRQLLHGSLTISLGPADSEDLVKLARETGCEVCNDSLPFFAYFDDRLQAFTHSADYQGGKVTIKYLSTDRDNLRSILDELRQIPDRPLEQKIAAASEKRASKTISERNQKNFSYNR